MIKTAAVSGALAVLLGAFGAHTLKELLTADQLSSFETGVRYQFYHTFAILLCGVLARTHTSKRIKMAALSFTGGIILFSGSIYILSTRSISGLEYVSILGPLTPIGGVLFVTGWILLALEAKNYNKP